MSIDVDRFRAEVDALAEAADIVGIRVFIFDAIKIMIAEAVAAEREACAQIAENGCDQHLIAATIRERKKPRPKVLLGTDTSGEPEESREEDRDIGGEASDEPFFTKPTEERIKAWRNMPTGKEYTKEQLREAAKKAEAAGFTLPITEPIPDEAEGGQQIKLYPAFSVTESTARNLSAEEIEFTSGSQQVSKLFQKLSEAQPDEPQVVPDTSEWTEPPQTDAYSK